MIVEVDRPDRKTRRFQGKSDPIDAMFELRTVTAGPLAIVNWSHVEASRITRIRVTFDPRPILT